MKTQIWNKTTIFWDMPLWSFGDIKINIPVYNWGNKEKECFHSLVEMKIVSNFNKRREARTAAIILKIEGLLMPPATDRDEIISLLEKIDDSITSVSNEKFSNNFIVNYRLKNRESFCDSAINKADLVLKTLGIADQKRFILSDFLPIQETLVKTTDGWIPYGDYLRFKHNLKPICTLYDRKIRDNDLEIKINYRNSPSNICIEQ